MIRFCSTRLVCGVTAGLLALATSGFNASEAGVGTTAAQLRLGNVRFPTSGAVAAQPHFLRGVAALHSFWYEEALEAFQTALRLDPNFAMAWWGVAMSYHRPFLPGSDDAAGRRALAQIHTPDAITPRELGYIAALRAWYADGTPEDRARAYAVAMRTLHRTYPDDLDAAAWYALSLLGSSWPEEGFESRHTAAGMIATDVYRRDPNHPGAAHYIIHSYDDPELAVRGLDAARHYATIAPDSPHAVHMPSHIYLQLGMWRETSTSNERAWSASTAWVQRKQLSLAQRDYHNYHWLIYSCLQEGRYAKAAELVQEFQRMRKDLLPDTIFFLQKAIAAFVVETRRWDRAEELFATAAPEKTAVAASSDKLRRVELCGAGAGRSTAEDGTRVAGIPDFIRTLAAAAVGGTDLEKRLTTLRAAAGGDAMPEFWRIRLLEILALKHAREKNFKAGIIAMQEATTIEEELGKPPGPPAAYKPPHELFGEILLQASRPAEAVVQFRKNLLLHPNRALSILGRARAEAAMGDKPAALATYTAFLKLWQHADRDLPEIAEAQAFVTSNHG